MKAGGGRGGGIHLVRLNLRPRLVNGVWQVPAAFAAAREKPAPKKVQSRL